MDVDQVLVIVYYYLRRKRIKTATERTYCVHPILREKFSLGTFQNLKTDEKLLLKVLGESGLSASTSDK